jgi:hypothetical protein
MQEMAMKMKSKGYMAGGKTKGYKAGGKMKMVENDGKKFHSLQLTVKARWPKAARFQQPKATSVAER